VSFLMRWAARRRDDEMRREAEPIEVVGHRARSRAELGVSDDPIIAGMGLGPRQRRRGRKS
jgi:hypothetical protein